jgi:hypothetical protein
VLGYHKTWIVGAELTDEETLLHEATQQMILAFAGCPEEHTSELQSH